MKQKLKKEFCKTIGFAVFIFVLTFFFFKEYVLQSSSTLASLFSSIIGVLLTFGLTWFLKNKSLFQMLMVILIYIIFIVVFAYSQKNNSITDSPVSKTNINSVCGNWVTKENDLILKLNISGKAMKMNFYPNNKQLFFEYEMNDNVIDFFNDDDVSNFQWKILKLTSDSLVVLEKKQILKFKKEK
ncbi:hypothetical protein [Flavobacterium tistrianum]|uniref:hypothetical protein n=1 Tax=Flavobacterium tistrianum TaxID=1685414 RepID=UPI000DADF3CE|nr:hypothetical protein [Flavobacterium tistrianum]KAF2341860.1 hypothetical protein DMB71_06355 [Flavobacterium tistrianum]